MTQAILPVSSITVLQQTGTTDKIYLKTGLPSTLYGENETTAMIQQAHGQGPDWVYQHFGRNPKIITL